MGKANRGIGVMKFMSSMLPGMFWTRCINFTFDLIRNCGDVLYHQYDPNFSSRLTTMLEYVQYSAAFAGTGEELTPTKSMKS